jgi:hypothetical protein
VPHSDIGLDFRACQNSPEGCRVLAYRIWEALRLVERRNDIVLRSCHADFLNGLVKLDDVLFSNAQ